jgi:hypothetical protein
LSVNNEGNTNGDIDLPPAPVVLFVFNRPDQTRRVLQAISVERPAKFYVVADGPRSSHPEDANLTRIVRELFQNVDWDCDLVRIYSDTNLGLRDRLLSGLDTVFSSEDYAIILEDDCLPGPPFFRYSNELLTRGRLKNLGIVSGTNFGPYPELSSSYHYSQSPYIWGWATWKAVWQDFRNSTQVDSWSSSEISDIKRTFSSKFEEFNFLHLMKEAHRLNTWDISFAVWLRLNGLLTAVPASNLIENIGFGSDATHTSGESVDPVLPAGTLKFPLTHPVIVAADTRRDRWIWRKRASSWLRFAIRHPLKLLGRLLKR